MSTQEPTDDQRRLDEFLNQQRDGDTADVLVNDDGRCQAYSTKNSRQCRHDALAGVPYCKDHYHLYDGE